MKFNADEVRKAIDTFKPGNELFEIRLVAGKKNSSGYFTSADKAVE